MTDLETFLIDNKDKIFRYYKYKKVYTPYELDKKFSDESMYENGGYAELCYIRQAIELPNKDVLLKLEITHSKEDNELYDEEELKEKKNNKHYIYEKLSDIVLEEYDRDN